MCQVNEEYHDGLEQAQVPGVSKKCVKCKEASAAVVIRAGDAYCRGCFKEYFIHKFRAMLGKNRIIFPGEKVLLAVSGGPSSCSMLSQVQEGLSQNAHKKLRFLPGIVFIDESGVLGQSLEERQKTVSELQAVFRATGFPFHMVPLEQVLEVPSSVVVTAPSPSDQPASAYKAAVDRFIQRDSSCPTSQEQKERSLPVVQEAHTRLLQQLVGSAKTLTAKQDLLNTLKQHLLVHTARTEGYSKVMLGDNCTRLAVKLLTSISVGRGAQLAQDTGFSDTRYGDIILVRPMREYSAKEIAFYNHMFSVASVFVPSLDTKSTEKASIQRLTESFVTKLQTEFPSTVSTIYRTSEKLQTSCRSSSTAEPSDRSVQLSQVKVPGSCSTKVPGLNQAPVALQAPAPSGQCCSSGGGGGEDCGRAERGGSCCSSTEKPEAIDLKSLLCYSCQLTVKDMSSVECLPQYILSEAKRRQRRSQMREDISEFLLCDGDGDDS